MAVDAVILAGALAEADILPDGKPMSRAMLPVVGKTMLQWLVDAMREASTVHRVIAVGRVDAVGVDRVLEPVDTFLGNVMLGLAAASGDKVLVSSSDIPLVSSDAIDDFVNRALAVDADFCFPIIPKEDCVRRYPLLKRTYAETREGTFTGGNMVLVNRDFMQRNERIIGEAYAQRKSVLRLARIVGFRILVRAFLAQLAFPTLLPISLLEETVSQMLCGRVKTILTHYPEIGEDIDKPADLNVVRKILSGAAGVSDTEPWNREGKGTG